MIDALNSVILEEAKSDNVIFLGRSADFVLQDLPNVVSVFTRDSIENRAARISKIYNVDTDEAIKLIELTDGRRSDFYTATTGKRWGDAQNYNITVNTGKLGGEEKLAELLEFLVK